MLTTDKNGVQNVNVERSRIACYCENIVFMCFIRWIDIL